MINSYIPILGLKGNNWFGPICLSWKTLRTSSHLLGFPNPNPQKHARKKIQFVRSGTSILIKKKIPGNSPPKKKPVLKLRFLLNLCVVPSGESRPHVRFQRVWGVSVCVEETRPDNHSHPVRQKVAAVWGVCFWAACCQSWLDRQQRRNRNVTCWIRCWTEAWRRHLPDTWQ